MCTYCMLLAATNDVQRAMAVASGPGEIRVDGEFIENTTAEGCFIVLQCEEESPDVFIALPLPDDAGTNVSSTIDNIPPSTYTMLVYDLEQDGLPNTHPAQTPSNTVTVDDGKSNIILLMLKYACIVSHSISGSMITPSSKFLKNATIYYNESAIELVCIYKDIAGDVSCVLVYREYGSNNITVRELSKDEETLSISLSDPDNYTFAVFGKSGSDFEKRPIISSRGLSSATTSPTDTTETTPTRSTVGSASMYI